jgi:hypothetical protein
MDINPYEYKDNSLYEFGNYHSKQRTDLIIFCANWLDSDSSEEESAYLSFISYVLFLVF